MLWPPDAKSWLIKKEPWCWERLKAGEGDDRRVWASSGSWVMDQEAWRAAVCEVTKSWTWLSNWITQIFERSFFSQNSILLFQDYQWWYFWGFSSFCCFVFSKMLLIISFHFHFSCEVDQFLSRSEPTVPSFLKVSITVLIRTLGVGLSAKRTRVASSWWCLQVSSVGQGGSTRDEW